jgi:hypothetical protein
MTERFNWYCICGAHWKGTLHHNTTKFLRREWDNIHEPGLVDSFGDKHGTTDRYTCKHARAKAAHNDGTERQPAGE